jgi:hypothetical protein
MIGLSKNLELLVCEARAMTLLICTWSIVALQLTQSEGRSTDPAHQQLSESLATCSVSTVTTGTC